MTSDAFRLRLVEAGLVLANLEALLVQEGAERLEYKRAGRS